MEWVSCISGDPVGVSWVMNGGEAGGGEGGDSGVWGGGEGGTEDTYSEGGASGDDIKAGVELNFFSASVYTIHCTHRHSFLLQSTTQHHTGLLPLPQLQFKLVPQLGARAPQVSLHNVESPTCLVRAQKRLSPSIGTVMA